MFFQILQMRWGIAVDVRNCSMHADIVRTEFAAVTCRHTENRLLCQGLLAADGILNPMQLFQAFQHLCIKMMFFGGYCFFSGFFKHGIAAELRHDLRGSRSLRGCTKFQMFQRFAGICLELTALFFTETRSAGGFCLHDIISSFAIPPSNEFTDAVGGM